MTAPELQALAARLAIESQKLRDSGAPRSDIIPSYERALEAARAYLISASVNDEAFITWTNWINATSSWLERILEQVKDNEKWASTDKAKDDGKRENEPEVQDDDKREPELEAEWTKSLVTNKKGDVLSIPFNVHLYLKNHSAIKGTIRWNSFAKRVEVTGGILAERIKNGISPPFDKVLNAVEDWLQVDANLTLRYPDLKRRVLEIAQDNTYNPLTKYLESVVWDGKARIDDFLIKYLGARTESKDGKDISDHIRTISRRWFISAVARAFKPGCQVDTILVVEGLQGLRKTSCFRVLGGEFSCETELAIGGNKDSKQLASTRWIIELAELDSIRGRETSTINAFLTARSDYFRPPYASDHEEFPRMCVFVGTTNREQYIEDSTGDRRYWPVWVTSISIKEIERDRDQLWAEAVAIYKQGGAEQCKECAASYDRGGEKRCPSHRWWLDTSEQRVASEESAERAEPIIVQDKVMNWWLGLGNNALSSRSIDPEAFSMADILDEALKIPAERWQNHYKIVGMLLKRLGFERFPDKKLKTWKYRPSEKLKEMRRS